MKTTVFSIFIALVILCAPHARGAQDLTVTGDTVALLANAVVTEADTHYRIPTAYNIPLGTRTATITLSGVCEIFARTLSTWGTNGSPFPKRVSGMTFTWHAPSQQHPELEPPADGHTRIPIMSQYTQFAAVGMVRMSETDPALTIPFSWTQQNKEKLTAAQLIVAMAALLAKRLQGAQNDAYTIARIFSPADWESSERPYSLLQSAPVVIPITLRIALNGIPPLPATDPDADAGPFPKPFCDTISINIDAGGPIRRIVVLLDGKHLATFDGAGTFGKSIESLDYPDGRHVLTLTASPLDGQSKPVTMTLPFQILNGRSGDFSPAEGP